MSSHGLMTETHDSMGDSGTGATEFTTDITKAGPGADTAEDLPEIESPFGEVVHRFGLRTQVLPTVSADEALDPTMGCG